MPWIIIGIIASYLLGSIPTAYIFGRIFKGIDIRKFGSGNVGATNALRVLGRPAGLAVLILDILKGMVAVTFLADFLAPKIMMPDEMLRIVIGISCISGHNWTIFLRFQGGKGIATTLGVLLGLAAKIEGLKVIVLLAVLTWFLVFIIFRIVALASILTAITLPLYMLMFRASNILILAGVILSGFVILRHMPNIKRLLHGQERRLF